MAEPFPSWFNKSLEALLRGYVSFNVSGYQFRTYNNALSFKNHMLEKNCLPEILFTGFHIFKGPRIFFHAFAATSRKRTHILMQVKRVIPHGGYSDDAYQVELSDGRILREEQLDRIFITEKL
jgi:hypothetical protein